MEPREIMLLSREQKVRQGSSSKPWKRAGRWRATPVLCASESLWITAALAGTAAPRIPPTTTEAAGQPLSRAGFPAAFNPTALTSLLPSAAVGRDAQEMGCGWGKQKGKCSTEPGEAPCRGRTWHSWNAVVAPAVPGERGLRFQPQQPQMREESTNPGKMKPCFA